MQARSRVKAGAGQLTPFEIGSDLSGSIRLPAHFCGVYGLPLGVQLVARRWRESRLLGIAQAIAPLTGGFQRPARM